MDGVAFLDRCIALFLNEKIDSHPLSRDTGITRLNEYFSDPEPERFSCATSASTALPFLTHPERNSLLEFAGKHPHHNVQIEVAWAGAKMEGSPESYTEVDFGRRLLQEANPEEDWS